MISDSMKIILLEDNPSDVYLIERQIKKLVLHPNIYVINEFEVLKKTLEEFDPDLILCDYRLKGFTGLDVLKYLLESNSQIPLVFVTGTIQEEEVADQTILEGVTGYVLKKDMNFLHEKLKPFFDDILGIDDSDSLDERKIKELEEYHKYLEGIKEESQILMNSYNNIKRSLETLRSKRKKSSVVKK